MLPNMQYKLICQTPLHNYATDRISTSTCSNPCLYEHADSHTFRVAEQQQAVCPKPRLLTPETLAWKTVLPTTAQDVTA